MVTHKSIIRGFQGATITTTLCGRMQSHLEDGYNVGDNVTCKHCLKAMDTYWGKNLIEQAEAYKTNNN